jgi:hypothetical protein
MTVPLIIFTVCDKPNHHLERLMASATHHGIDLVVRGLGEPYTGNGKKRALVHDFLTTCPPDAIFMYVDAFDVIFLAGEKEIHKKYTTHYDGQFLLGAEQNLGMYAIDDLYYFFKYPIKNQRFKYLNAGTMMGPVKKGIALLETLGINEHQASDQMDMIRYFTKNKTAFSLDHHHHIFGVNGGRAGLESRDYKIQNNRLYSVPTDTWPTLLHVPGKFFIGLDAIANELGFMSRTPDYSKKEQKAYAVAKREHTICDRWGIENYIFRIIKNWMINIGIILTLLGLVWGAIRAN